MKKILTVSFLIASALTLCIKPYEAKIEVCAELVKSIKSSCHAQKLFKTLGHNPDIKLIQKENPSVIKNGPILVFHGWKSSPDDPKWHRLCLNSEHLPGDVITFRFKDASHWIDNKIYNGMPWYYSSFGGLYDVQTALVTLKVLLMTDALPTCFYAHSRGAKVAHDVLCILSNPIDKDFETILKKCHLDAYDCQKILSTLKMVYLITPLANFENTFEIIAKRDFLDKNIIWRYLPERQQKLFLVFLRKYLLPWFSKYTPHNYAGMVDYNKKCNPTAINAHVVLHLEKNDLTVGNNFDEILITQCASHLNQNFHVTYTDNGGHRAFNIFLDKALHVFNKAYGCSYHSERADILPHVIHDSQVIFNTESIQTSLDTFCNCYTEKQ